jgi:membrane protease YdiL (CAAX protease family)
MYAAWILITNYFMEWRGPWDFSAWAKLPVFVAALRVLAVGVLGPIAEELIFRGILFHRLRHTRVGDWGAILILAAVWAVVHTSYTSDVIALIFVSGLFLGWARKYTGSVFVPIIMHILWNLYAVW